MTPCTFVSGSFRCNNTLWVGVFLSSTVALRSGQLQGLGVKLSGAGAVAAGCDAAHLKARTFRTRDAEVNVACVCA